jgi:hypothetical protein
VQSKTAKEIDLEARAAPLGWLCDPETLGTRGAITAYWDWREKRWREDSCGRNR